MPSPDGKQREIPGVFGPESRRGLPLRRRLFISSLLGAIPLIILGFILLFERYTSQRDLLLSGNQAQATLAAAYTEGWLDGQIRILRTLARSNEVQTGSLADQQALLQRQVRAQPDWDSMWIADAGGQLIVNTKPQLFNISDREYFRQAKLTLRPAVSNVMIGRVTGQNIIAIAYPIIDNTGFFAGLSRPAYARKRFNASSPRCPPMISLSAFGGATGG